MKKSNWICALSAVMVAGVSLPAALAQSLLAPESEKTAAPASESGWESESNPNTAAFLNAWQLVSDTHFDPEYNGVDWPALREELLPRARELDSIEETRALIGEMLDRLGQSHFGVIPKSAAGALERTGGDADPGFDIRMIEGFPVITSVRDGSPGDLAGVELGWVLVSVDGQAIDEVIKPIAEAIDGPGADIQVWQVLQRWITGPKGSFVRLGFLDQRDEEVTLSLPREPSPGRVVRFGNLPPMRVMHEHEWLDPEVAGDLKIGVIRFNLWMPIVMNPIQQAMLEFQDADGIIIDLRGNLGGVGGLSMGVAGYFVDEPTDLGTMTMRGQTINFRGFPRRVTNDGTRLRPFLGPVAILTDSISASTSEVFAGGMQAVDRATVIGQTTAGAALPAAMSPLSNGDVLLHAIGDFVTSDGRLLEHDGVRPDIEVPLSKSDLGEGIDPTESAAAAWIREKLSTQSTTDE